MRENKALASHLGGENSTRSLTVGQLCEVEVAEAGADEGVWLCVTFCHKGSVICISEIIDISPGNLDSSL